MMQRFQYGFNGAAEFTRRNAEPANPKDSIGSRSFNGAAEFTRRNVSGPSLNECSPNSLQWSRRVHSAECELVVVSNAGSGAASMEPPSSLGGMIATPTHLATSAAASMEPP